MAYIRKAPRFCAEIADHIPNTAGAQECALVHINRVAVRRKGSTKIRLPVLIND